MDRQTISNIQFHNPYMQSTVSFIGQIFNLFLYMKIEKEKKNYPAEAYLKIYFVSFIHIICFIAGFAS